MDQYSHNIFNSCQCNDLQDNKDTTPTNTYDNTQHTPDMYDDMMKQTNILLYGGLIVLLYFAFRKKI